MLYDALAALLEYPVVMPADPYATALREAAPHPRAAVHLAAFAGAARQLPLSELQEHYTKTFDFESDAALYAGHHLFGEDGRRGLLIAGLVERYRGLGVDAGLELADHFSPMLRSLAIDADSEEAQDLLQLVLQPALAKVLPAVERRSDTYAAVLHALAMVIDERTCRSFCSPYSRTSPS